MKVWQIVLIVLAAITLLVGVIVGGVFYATSGITDAGDEFFEAARRGDYEAAYALTSTELRNDSDVIRLQRYLEGSGLDKVTDTSWSSRSMENNVGRLEGSVTTESGGTIPLKMQLVKEKGGWKIAMIETMPSGLSDGGGMAGPGAAGGGKRTVA